MNTIEQMLHKALNDLPVKDMPSLLGTTIRFRVNHTTGDCMYVTKAPKKRRWGSQ